MNTRNLFPANTAVLAQFEPATALAPLTARRAPAMLEVLGAPLLHHWLNALSIAGVSEVFIVASTYPEQLRQFIGRGERWGFMKVEFVSSGALHDWQDVRNRLPAVLPDQVAWCSLNAYPTEPLIRLAESNDFHITGPGDRNAGVRKAMPITSPRELFDANMFARARLHTTQVEPGAVIDEAVRSESPCWIGRRAFIEAQNRIENSVIGKDVRIRAGSELDQVVILGNSLVGSHLSLSRVIIDGPVVCDIDSDCTLQIDDPLLFSRLTVARQRVSLAERFLAAGLLMVTAPVLLFGKTRHHELRIAAGTDFAGKAVDRRIPVTSLKTQSQFAKRIPWLVAVIKGRLPLFGTREHDGVLTQLPGVISLADFVPQNDIDVSIANQYQVHASGMKENLALAGKWLPRAMMRR